MLPKTLVCPSSPYVLPISLGEGDGTPLQYSCLEKPHGWKSLVGYSPWGHEESDTTERPHFHFSFSCIGEGNGKYSCLENPRDGGAWWAVVYGVTQSQTRLRLLSSSSSRSSSSSSSSSTLMMCITSKFHNNFVKYVFIPFQSWEGGSIDWLITCPVSKARLGTQDCLILIFTLSTLVSGLPLKSRHGIVYFSLNFHIIEHAVGNRGVNISSWMVLW